jgi:DNA-directed RNA polymerase II subunit RPB2
MTKQAIGVYATNHGLRSDTVVHTLNYPQKPIVKTEFADVFGYDDMPYGINVTIAVLCYTGFNQEDSVIINKSAIDRGLFVTNSFKTTLCDEKKRSGNTSESIELPPLEIRKRGLYYGKLGDDGIVAEGTYVAKNDVIVGKVLSKFNKEDEEEKSDCSISIKADEEGIIDKVIVTTNAEGYKMVKIRIRNVRIPVIGDKFASRAGQKGTCGMMYRQEDMPFTASGIIPDVIINPHAFPSRMTINQLLESLLGKKCCLDGTRGDSTPFTKKSDDPVHYIMDGLKKAGMQHEGYEVMYNGFTGEALKSQVFMGVCYYQRLKHMVTDKIHARAFGNVTVLSRQPLEGRSRDGGLRCGEMERDCLIAHGASSFLRERLFNMSDPYKIVVCEKCGSVASDPEECRSCREDKLVPVNIPYACKLLLQELNAMGIKTSVMPKVK